MVDAGDGVDEHADEVDSKAGEKFVDSQVNEQTNQINQVASKGGNVVSQSVDGDTDGSDSDSGFAVTSSRPPRH